MEIRQRERPRLQRWRVAIERASTNEDGGEGSRSGVSYGKTSRLGVDLIVQADGSMLTIRKILA